MVERSNKQLASSKGIAPLIPKPLGNKVYLGSGASSFAVLQIIRLAQTNSAEAAKLAQHLTGFSLANTLANIHGFIFNNFQNISEAGTHQLQTLSAAYHGYRQIGINCEDTTVIALQLLDQLGIKSFVRKIHQAHAPGVASHVYVIVPLNQNTGVIKNLADYYTIDGTLPQANQEAHFLKSFDIMAEPKIKYYGLNGPNCPNCSNGPNNWQDIVKDFESSIDGQIGGSKNHRQQLVDKTGADKYVPEVVADIASWLEQLQVDILDSIFKTDALEAKRLRDLIEQIAKNNWYQVPASRSSEMAGLGFGDVNKMTPAQLQYFLNTHYPYKYNQNINKDWGNAKDRVIKRWTAAFEWFKKMAQERLKGNDPTSLPGGVKNGTTGKISWTGKARKQNKDERIASGDLSFNTQPNDNGLFNTSSMGWLGWGLVAAGAYTAYKTISDNKSKGLNSPLPVQL